MKCEIIYLWEWEMVEKGTRLFERRENRWMECDACALGGFRWCFYRVHHANIHKDPNSYFSFFWHCIRFCSSFSFPFRNNNFWKLQHKNKQFNAVPQTIRRAILNTEHGEANRWLYYTMHQFPNSDSSGGFFLSNINCWNCIATHHFPSLFSYFLRYMH